ncbi:MAG: VWA domain-containing protein [Candidatus Kapabacteria bacterium]|nr:VWA domain-containing protein [Candidatus Kapabacteria bacterium]
MHTIRLASFIAALCLVTSALQAQFPVTRTLSSRSPDAVVTPPTRPNARYRVTVRGTYSQWPQFTDCRGVDAVWVYDVPQAEIDAFRWPPRRVLGAPFVEIPHWVGDSTVYAFPPKGLGMNPLFEISFRKYLGFRINGEPLPPMPIDQTFHRYQHTMAGTGEPLRFQIVDSTYNVMQGAVIPRYEDNCGELTIDVEEILDKDVNICDVKPIKVGNDVVGLRIDASIVSLDSTQLSGTRNELFTKEQLGIVADGKFICPDSLVCDTGRTEPISIGLVVDVSGSMQEDITYNNVVMSRLDAVKRSIHEFMRRLKPNDSLFLIQFDQAVRLTQNWTTDTAAVGRAIDRLTFGGNTAFYDALSIGCSKLSTHARKNKALVALTDGQDNRSRVTSAEVIDVVRRANVPVYLIALGFTGEPGEKEAVDTMAMFVKAAPAGRVNQVLTGGQLEAIYTDIAENFAKEECCRLYFRIPPCDKGQSKRTISLVFIDGDHMISKRLLVDCDLKVTSVKPDDVDWNADDLASAVPTPSDEAAHLDVTLTTAGNSVIELYSVDGAMVQRTDHGFVDIGRRRFTLATDALPNGIYFCRIVCGLQVQTAHVIVRH